MDYFTKILSLLISIFTTLNLISPIYSQNKYSFKQEYISFDYSKLLVKNNKDTGSITWTAKKNNFIFKIASGITYYFDRPLINDNNLKYFPFTYSYNQMSIGYIINENNEIGLTVGNSLITNNIIVLSEIAIHYHNQTYDTTYVFTSGYDLKQSFWFSLHYIYDFKGFFIGSRIGILFPAPNKTIYTTNSFFIGKKFYINKFFVLSPFISYSNISTEFNIQTIRSNQINLIFEIGYQF